MYFIFIISIVQNVFLVIMSRCFCVYMICLNCVLRDHRHRSMNIFEPVIEDSRVQSHVFLNAKYSMENCIEISLNVPRLYF